MRPIIRRSPAQAQTKRPAWQGLTAPGRCTTLAPGTWRRSGAEQARLPMTDAGGMAMQWRHRTAVVNGIHIHYVTHGQGAPVILLHGWPEFWYSWRKQIPVLGAHCEVIVPDMRGIGYSDKPHTGYDTRTAASDMYALARVLGHQRVSIVAHDIGARVAYRFTLDHEETVVRLSLLDATPPHER